MTQFPATLNPYIGSMLAKSYVLAAMVRPTAIVGKTGWTDACCANCRLSRTAGLRLGRLGI